MANPFDQFDAPKAAEANPFDQFDPTERGIATTLVGYLSQGLASMATAPFRGIHAAAEGAKTMREEGRMSEDVPVDVQEAYGQLGGAELINKALPKGLYSGGWLDQPAPVTTGEKYAAAVGSGLAAAAVPELGLVAKGPQLARAAQLAPGSTARRMVAEAGKFYADQPGVAVSTGGLAAGGAAATAEAAKEADLGPGYEVAAGMAGPAALTAPLRFAGRAAQATEFVTAKMGLPTITPSATLAGWESRGGFWRAVATPFQTTRAAGRELNDLILAPRETLSRWDRNAQGILRRIGLPMSADEPPTATLTLTKEQAETQARAYQILANQLMRAGQTPDDIAGVFNAFADYRRLHSSGLAQNTLFMADIPPFTSLGGAASLSSASNLPREAVAARQTGITPMTTTAEKMAALGLPTGERFAPPMTGAQAQRRFGKRFDTPERSIVPQGQKKVIEDAFRRALLIESEPHHRHQGSGLRTIEQIAADRELESGPAYDAVYNAGRRVDGSDVDLRPAANPVLHYWEVALVQEPGPVAARIEKGIATFRRALEADVSMVPLLRRQTMIERFDRAKRSFEEEVLNPLYKSLEGKSPWTAGVVNKFKNDMIAAVDSVQENNVGPLYKKAREVWSSRQESIDDIRLGIDAWKADSEIGADVMQGANANVRLGLLQGWMLQAERLPTGGDAAKLFDNHRIMAIVAAAIPKTESGTAVFANRAQRFGGFINAQQAQVRTLTEIARGSPTAARQQALQDLNDMQTVVETVHRTGVKGIAIEVAYTALNKLFGYRQNTAEAVARMLFTADPEANAATIEGIRQHMGPDRFSYFTRVLAQHMNQGGVYRGAVPGAAVAAQPGEEAPP